MVFVTTRYSRMVVSEPVYRESNFCSKFKSVFEKPVWTSIYITVCDGLSPNHFGDDEKERADLSLLCDWFSKIEYCQQFEFQ